MSFYIFWKGLANEGLFILGGSQNDWKDSGGGRKLRPGVVGGADLGGLAHLLLKLSSDAIVLFNAQRKGLGRFLGLKLRLVREKNRKLAGLATGHRSQT